MSMYEREYREALHDMAIFLEGCAKNPERQKEHLSGAGAVFQFEQQLAAYYGKRFALTFSSATTAMQALCLACELHSSEILTSPFNWGGSITPFLLHNNKLRFVEFEPDTLSLSVDDLGKAITQKTKAVISVDYHGFPADAKAINLFCREHGLHYISDSAQSLGAFRDGKPAGFYADAAVLSFSSGKTLYAGEGGAIVTDDEALYERLLQVAHHPSRQKMAVGLTGYTEFTPLNGRINPLAAIVLKRSFATSLIQLHKKQACWWTELMLLQDAGLITLPAAMRHQNSTTGFKSVFLLQEPSTISDVEEYCRCSGLQKTVSTPALLPIPANRTFIQQFKGKYSCSESLKKQLRSFDSSHYVEFGFITRTA
jgi:perosamine synthetase